MISGQKLRRCSLHDSTAQKLHGRLFHLQLGSPQTRLLFSELVLAPRSDLFRISFSYDLSNNIPISRCSFVSRISRHRDLSEPRKTSQHSLDHPSSSDHRNNIVITVVCVHQQNIHTFNNRVQLKSSRLRVKTRTNPSARSIRRTMDRPLINHAVVLPLLHKIIPSRNNSPPRPPPP